MALSNNSAWQKIFERYNILDAIKKKGFYDLSAQDIKSVDAKEPRLMTKIDHKEHLPQIMKENGLAILAIKNGLYRIAKFDPFIEIKEQFPPPRLIKPPTDLESIDPFSITNETSALDICNISDIFEHLFGEKAYLTIRGRVRGSLLFKLNDISFPVEGVQIEVDGGYEGKSFLHLIEAKIGYRSNLTIRQLLYPLLFWQQKVKKPVKSYIFFYQEGVFRFIPYIYDGNRGYADHENEKTFLFVPQKSSFSLYAIPIDENNVDQRAPFPQADTFARVHDLFLSVAQGARSKKELFLEFDLPTYRQFKYYLDVLRWMKLCHVHNGTVALTKKGEKIANLTYYEQLQAFATTIFSEPICNHILHKRTVPSSLWERYGLKSESTQKRRMQTIKRWIDFFTDKLHSLFEGEL